MTVQTERRIRLAPPRFEWPCDLCGRVVTFRFGVPAVKQCPRRRNLPVHRYVWDGEGFRMQDRHWNQTGWSGDGTPEIAFSWEPPLPDRRAGGLTTG